MEFLSTFNAIAIIDQDLAVPGNIVNGVFVADRQSSQAIYIKDLPKDFGRLEGNTQVCNVYQGKILVNSIYHRRVKLGRWDKNKNKYVYDSEANRTTVFLQAIPGSFKKVEGVQYTRNLTQNQLARIQKIMVSTEISEQNVNVQKKEVDAIIE